MENNFERKKYRRKLNALILLVAFTAIMLIVSTYAWFSTQRTVTISNITGTVNVAEGLEISLDARNWSNAIDLSSISNLKTYIANNGYDGNNSITPDQMVPVSTEGTIGGTTIKMYKGIAGTSTGLETVYLCDETETKTSENDYPNYIAFDVFLRDSSRTDDAVPLYLTNASTVTVKENGDTQEQYGLQNTIRVGFARYLTTSDYSSDQIKIITDTTGTNTVSQLSIWEPNANYHVNYSVINNNNFKEEGLTGAILRDAEGAVTTGSNVKFTRDDVINTYALKDGAETTLASGTDNVYAWGTGTTMFAPQYTVKTKISVPSYTDETYATAETYPGNGGYSMTTTGNGTAIDPEVGVALTQSTSTAEAFTIGGNCVTRLRLYVWLEGQDVDCINYASHGGGIDVDLGLQKAASTTTTPTATVTP